MMGLMMGLMMLGRKMEDGGWRWRGGVAEEMAGDALLKRDGPPKMLTGPI